MIVDDGQIFVLVGGAVVDDETEAVGQGNGLVHAVGLVELVLPRVTVPPRFLDQVAAVGGGINQYVFGAGFDAALDGGFQILVFGLGFLEGKVVKEDDEMLGGKAPQFVHDARQARKLRFGNLHETQSHGKVFVGQRLD